MLILLKKHIKSKKRADGKSIRSFKYYTLLIINLKSSNRVFGISVAEHSVGYFKHFFFSKIGITGKFCIYLIIVFIRIEAIGGNTISFSFLKFIGKNIDAVSCVTEVFFAGFNKMLIINIEGSIFDISKAVPFAVVAEFMKLKGIMEEDVFITKVYPMAENVGFIGEVIIIFGFKNNGVGGFGIKSFCFLFGLASGKKKNDAKND